MESGALQISIERGKQVTSNFSILYDVLKNQHNELIRAASIIITPEYNDINNWRSLGDHWPDSLYRKIIEKPITERWAIAGALLAAAIDREQIVMDTSTTP